MKAQLTTSDYRELWWRTTRLMSYKALQATVASFLICFAATNIVLWISGGLQEAWTYKYSATIMFVLLVALYGTWLFLCWTAAFRLYFRDWKKCQQDKRLSYAEAELIIGLDPKKPSKWLISKVKINKTLKPIRV